MMHDSWLWVPGLGHILLIVIAALIIAALLKYLFRG